MRKFYPRKAGKKAPKRIWKLERLARDAIEEGNKKDEEQAEADFEGLMQNLEEDPELRTNVNMYKVPNVEEIIRAKQDASNKMDEEEDSDTEYSAALPDVKLEELLEPLNAMSLKE